MAVTKMNIVKIIGQMNQLDNVIRVCGDSGCFHPDNAMSFFSDIRGFCPLNEENPYSGTLQRLTGILTQCLLTYRQTKFDKLTIPENEFRTYVAFLGENLHRLKSEINSTKIRIETNNLSISQLDHFFGLNINLDEVFACETIKVRFGRLPAESFEKLQHYNKNPYVLFFPSHQSENYYWGVYFSPVEYVMDVDRIFSSLYFERLRLPKATGTPADAAAVLTRTRDDDLLRLEALESELQAFWEKEKEVCQMVYSKLLLLNTYFETRRYAAKYNGNFILTGWVPTSASKEFDSSLQELDGVDFTIEDDQEVTNHSPPVLLKNNKVFKPFEFFVDMYGLPSYKEVDPTTFVGITYMLLFGIMFGDLGQGILLSLAGLFMWKKKGMQLGNILIRCGICSSIFGIVYGSVFGFEHVLDPLFEWLGISFLPIHALDNGKTLLVIGASVVLGVLLMIVSMCINIYSATKQKKTAKMLFSPNGLSGLIFYVSLIALTVGPIALGWSIPSWISTSLLILLVFLPLILIFFREPLEKLVVRKKNWQPKSWGEYVTQNIFEMIEFLLSYLSNTISFLRVGAFVLVHAGMMLMVNMLAGDKLNAGFIIAQIIGNIIVTCVEALLVGIQVLRLEFYEMFSHFFEGSGRKFDPVGIKDKD